MSSACLCPRSVNIIRRSLSCTDVCLCSMYQYFPIILRQRPLGLPLPTVVVYTIAPRAMQCRTNSIPSTLSPHFFQFLHMCSSERQHNPGTRQPSAQRKRLDRVDISTHTDRSHSLAPPASVLPGFNSHFMRLRASSLLPGLSKCASRGYQTDGSHVSSHDAILGPRLPLPPS